MELVFLYHHVPKNQSGSFLYPLNQLKVVDPELYTRHASKYDNIKEKDVEIPGFGYWNDCINLMPIQPSLVKAELEKYGHDTNWEWRFYKINSEKLDNMNLIIMLMNDNGSFERQFLPFNKENFDKYCHIGETTRAVYQKAKFDNEQPNTFARIPHVLYRGSIDTQDLEIVGF